VIATVKLEREPKRGNRAAILSGDGRLAAAGLYGQAGIVILDVQTGKELASCVIASDIPGRNLEVIALAFSPDSSKVAWSALLPASGNTARTRAGIWEWQSKPDRQVTVASQGSVQALQFSPNGKLLAVGDYEIHPPGPGRPVIRVINVETNQEQAKLEGLEMPCQSLGFSPDGNLLAAGTLNCQLRVWNLADQKMRRFLAPRRPDDLAIFHTAPAITSISFSPDGKAIATGIATWYSVPIPISPISLWDVEKNERYAGYVSDSRGIGSVRFSSDGTQLVTSGGNGTARLWDLNRRQEPSILKMNDTYTAQGVGAAGSPPVTLTVPNPPVGLLAAPEGKIFVSRAHNGELKLWDYSRGMPRAPSLVGMTDSFAYTFSRDGASFAFGLADPKNGPDARGKVQVWDVTRKKALPPFRAHDSRITCIAFADVDPALATGSAMGEVKVWKASDRGDGGKLPCSLAAVTSLVFSPDGKFLAGAGFDESAVTTVEVWAVPQETRVCKLTGRRLAQEPRPGNVPSAQADGRRAFLRVINPNSPRGPSVAFSPDSQTLALLDADMAISLWSTIDWQFRAKELPVSSLPPPQFAASVPGPGHRLSYLPSGRGLVVSSFSSVSILDPLRGVEGAVSERLPFSSAAAFWDVCSSGGSLPIERSMATSAEKGIVLRDPLTLKEHWTFRRSAPVNAPVAFSSDGKTFITPDYGGMSFYSADVPENPPSLLGEILKDLSDRDSLVRANTIETIMTLGPKARRILPEIIRISLGDPDAGVRERAKSVLSKLGYKD
jgi:WD40 repeat protein